jgi:hypothetical protein
VKVLRGFGVVLAGLVLAAIAIAVAARFSDGPICPLAGGALIEGPLVTDETVDWERVRGEAWMAELQLIEPPRSRTVGFVVVDGELYVPCFYPGLSAWKQWPHEAVRDGRAILRLEGTRYARDLVRVTDPAVYEPVWEAMVEELGAPGRESVWIFHLAPWPVARLHFSGGGT